MHQDASRSRDLRPPCALQGSVGPTCSPRAVWPWGAWAVPCNACRGRRSRNRDASWCMRLRSRSRSTDNAPEAHRGSAICGRISLRRSAILGFRGPRARAHRTKGAWRGLSLKGEGYGGGGCASMFHKAVTLLCTFAGLDLHEHAGVGKPKSAVLHPGNGR